MDPFKAIQEGFLKNAPVYFKMGALFFLVLILLIPIGMVESLISERQDRQQEATSWIGDIWGREQNFFGPVLIIPYERTVESVDKDGGKKPTSSMAGYFTCRSCLRYPLRHSRKCAAVESSNLSSIRLKPVSAAASPLPTSRSPNPMA